MVKSYMITPELTTWNDDHKFDDRLSTFITHSHKVHYKVLPPDNLEKHDGFLDHKREKGFTVLIIHTLRPSYAIYLRQKD